MTLLLKTLATVFSVALFGGLGYLLYRTELATFVGAESGLVLTLFLLWDLRQSPNRSSSISFSTPIEWERPLVWTEEEKGKIRKSLQEYYDGKKPYLILPSTSTSTKDLVEALADSQKLDEVRRIMKERLWFPRFCGVVDSKQRWRAFSWHEATNLRDTLAVDIYVHPRNRSELCFEDPITCLIETEKWYIENVEKPHKEATND